MKLSIIIINHHSQEYLKKCIGTIHKGSSLLMADYEVIIVNNDENQALLSRSHLDRNVKIIHTGRNLGFGRACNKGAKKAQGKVLLFLNPDMEIVAGDWEKIIGEIREIREIGVIGVNLIKESGKTQEWCAGAEVTFFDIIKNNLGIFASKKIWESRKKVACAWVSGAALFIKKDLFQKLGGFDEKFFMYFEDIDLCRRARQAGYKIVYYPDFIIKHLGGKSFSEKAVQKKYYYASQDHYFQKHFGKHVTFWVKILRKLFS